jgi:hypothetical protein
MAGLMLLLFAVGGNFVLSLLHVSLPAFRVAGGMLLFLQALTLTFSSPGLSSIDEGERQDAEKPGDIAVFPLAFPLIASPRRALSGRAADWPSRRLDHLRRSQERISARLRSRLTTCPQQPVQMSGMMVSTVLLRALSRAPARGNSTARG